MKVEMGGGGGGYITVVVVVAFVFWIFNIP